MIQLNALNYERPIWVNQKLITSLEQCKEYGPLAGTVIYFDNGNDVKVRETPAEVLALIDP